MANHKSAEKRVRSSKRKAQVNKHWKSSIKTFEKKLRESLKGKDGKETKKLLSGFFSLVDRAARRGVIHKNTAGRKKALFSSRADRL